MRTAKQSLEVAIQTLCERSGLDVEEGVKGVWETLESNGYVIVPRDPTEEMCMAAGLTQYSAGTYRSMIAAALSD